MATVKFSKPIKTLSTALAALFLSPALAAALMPWDNAYLNNGAEGFASPLPGGAYQPEFLKPGKETISIKDVPSSLCELVEGMHAKDRAHVSQSPAAFPELLDDSGGPVSTGLGYDLGPGLRFQGVGVFNMEENYAFLGPAFTLNIEGDLAITTGMQLPVAGDGGPDKPSGLYYAEFRLLF